MGNLIHCITNYVTMNDVANVCLAIGSRPIMADAYEEISEISSQADGLLLNLGTPNPDRIKSIHLAYKKAKELNRPCLIDPVGCHTSEYRLKLVLSLLDMGFQGVLKVNGSEAKAIIQKRIAGDGMGVDSQRFSQDDQFTMAKEIHKRYGDNVIVVVTGMTDVVVSCFGITIVEGTRLEPLNLVGTGCMLNAVIMSGLIKVTDSKKVCSTEFMYNMTVRSVRLMKRSLERARQQTHDRRLIGTFKTRLIDELGRMSKVKYLITDHTMNFPQLLELTEKAIIEGVDILQYRGKGKTYDQQVEEAKQLLTLTRKYHIPLIINDSVKLAYEIGAEGVHLGQSDGDVPTARKQLGSNSIIGVTAKTPKQGIDAEKQGADYIGSGALYKSPTKKDAVGISMDTLAEIYKSVSIPVYGIGGMTNENITPLIRQYTDGIVMVSGIYKPLQRQLID